MPITANNLIEKFRYALDNKWGYIWGTAGVQWTTAKQKQKVDYMVNKYGTSWQKNSEAKNDTYYNAAVYGSKWVGHYVADCSGLFVWAYKQLGASIAHGSNSIYDRYCSSKGQLTDSLKKTLLPGTAVFTGDSRTHGHIGLYAGNGKVIESQGTQEGVCTSNLTAGKWTYYGLLKDVSYDAAQPEPVPAVSYPTVKRGSRGEYVKKVQTILQKLGYNLGVYGIDGDFGTMTEKAVKEFQQDHKLTSDGIVGAKTWEALLKANDAVSPPKEKKYTVTVKGLTKTQADELKKKYPDAVVAEEKE